MRLVPVDSHVKFEKVKQAAKPATVAQSQPQIDIQAALARHGVTTAAPKKENVLSKLRNNIRRSIAATNRTINTLGTTSTALKTELATIPTSKCKEKESKSSVKDEVLKAPKKKKKAAEEEAPPEPRSMQPSSVMKTSPRIPFRT